MYQGFVIIAQQSLDDDPYSVNIIDQFFSEVVLM